MQRTILLVSAFLVGAITPSSSFVPGCDISIIYIEYVCHCRNMTNEKINVYEIFCYIPALPEEVPLHYADAMQIPNAGDTM